MPTMTVADVFETCIARIDDAVLRQNLREIAGIITDAETTYRQLAMAGRTHEHSVETDVGTVSRRDLEKVYTNRMSRGKAPGRHYYDQLRLAAPHSICPMCGERPVQTLDHYLAKTKYPRFVVTPINLVPCCSDCNKAKTNETYDTGDSLPIHPYFDHVDGVTWLTATVVEVSPPAAVFTCAPPTDMDPQMRLRIVRHFDRLHLAQLYASKAAEELSQIITFLDRLRERADAEAVRLYLEDQVRSRRKLFRNTWQAALYEATAQSVWFCEGRYRLT